MECLLTLFGSVVGLKHMFRLANCRFVKTDRFRVRECRLGALGSPGEIISSASVVFGAFEMISERRRQIVKPPELENAMLAVFEEGKVRTRDIGGTAKTAEFAP